MITFCPWQAISQVFNDFSNLIGYLMANSIKIHFWEDSWLGELPLKIQFLNLLQDTRTTNVFVSSIVDSSSLNSSWNFNSHQNLSNPEIEDLPSLLSSLHHVYILPSFLNKRVWLLTPSKLFCTSFYKALVDFPHSTITTSFACSY